MPDYNELSDGRPDGARLGQTASDLVAFHGATPTDQCAYIATVTASTTLTSVVTALNSVIAALVEKGLVASS